MSRHGPRRIRVHRKSYRRAPYTARRGRTKYRVRATRVPSTTFYERDQGLPGRGPTRIGRLKKGGLHGWHENQSAETRREHIKEAVRNSSFVTVFRRLNALAVLDKRTNPKVARKAEEDKRWLIERERVS